jgi:hypothetical protein
LAAMAGPAPAAINRPSRTEGRRIFADIYIGL